MSGRYTGMVKLRTGYIIISVIFLVFSVYGASKLSRPAIAEVGKLDDVRFRQILKEMDASILVDAERLYEEEKYEESLKMYQKFEKEILPSKSLANVIPYAIFMQGVCLLRLGYYKEAREKFYNVISLSKDDMDSTMADYYIGTTYKFSGDIVKAIEHYESFIRHDRSRKHNELYMKALDWLASQYRQLMADNPDYEKKYYDICYLKGILLPGSPVWHEAYDHFKKLRDWDKCFELNKVRTDVNKANTITTFEKLSAFAEDYQADKEGVVANLLNFTTFIEDYLFKSNIVFDEVNRNVCLSTVETLLKCEMPQKAGEIMIKWFEKSKGDLTAYMAYCGMVNHISPVFDPEIFNAVTEAILKDCSMKKEIFDKYIEVYVNKMPKRNVALFLLDKYGGDKIHYGMLYRGWDDREAIRFLKDVALDERYDEDSRREAALWIAEALFNESKFKECLPYLNVAIALTRRNSNSREKLCKLRTMLVQIYENMGEIEKAVNVARENLESRSGTRNVREKVICQFIIASYLLKSSDPEKNLEGEKILRDLLGQKGKDLLVRFSEDSEIRLYQDKALSLCKEYGINLETEPSLHFWKQRKNSGL